MSRSFCAGGRQSFSRPADDAATKKVTRIMVTHELMDLLALFYPYKCVMCFCRAAVMLFLLL